MGAGRLDGAGVPRDETGRTGGMEGADDSPREALLPTRLPAIAGACLDVQHSVINE